MTPDPLNPPPGRAPDTASSRQRSDRGWTWARFWLMTIAALVTVSSTISLGRWQLSRAAQKEALQAEIDGQKLTDFDLQLILEVVGSSAQRPDALDDETGYLQSKNIL